MASPVSKSNSSGKATHVSEKEEHKEDAPCHVKEACRKCGRTFSATLNPFNRKPGHHFFCLNPEQSRDLKERAERNQHVITVLNAHEIDPATLSPAEYNDYKTRIQSNNPI